MKTAWELQNRSFASMRQTLNTQTPFSKEVATSTNHVTLLGIRSIVKVGGKYVCMYIQYGWIFWREDILADC